LETAAQAARLRILGCRRAQGYCTEVPSWTVSAIELRDARDGIAM
jgi:EAL domain-containing protein (putative c-di-GMP-specific phosphodiesterase class I)